MVSGPAGTRCPDCASLRGTHLYKINPLHIVVQAVIGVASGAIGSLIVDQMGFFVFFIFFLAPVYGGGVAELMLKAIGRKHGRLVEFTGAVSFVLGGLIPVMYDVVIYHSPMLFIEDWRQLLGIGIAASACFARLKYF
jgi:hypothetical protein